MVDLVWSVGLVSNGKPAAFWVGHCYNIILPTITSREINTDESVHNDHKHLILRSDSGPTGLCGISTEILVRPIDYIGLYLIVTASSLVTVNILYRIYY